MLAAAKAFRVHWTLRFFNDQLSAFLAADLPNLETGRRIRDAMPKDLGLQIVGVDDIVHLERVYYGFNSQPSIPPLLLRTLESIRGTAGLRLGFTFEMLSSTKYPAVDVLESHLLELIAIADRSGEIEP